jgi:hypothetical protein
MVNGLHPGYFEVEGAESSQQYVLQDNKHPYGVVMLGGLGISTWLTGT